MSTFSFAADWTRHSGRMEERVRWAEKGTCTDSVSSGCLPILRDFQGGNCWQSNVLRLTNLFIWQSTPTVFALMDCVKEKVLNLSAGKKRTWFRLIGISFTLAGVKLSHLHLHLSRGKKDVYDRREIKTAFPIRFFLPLMQFKTRESLLCYITYSKFGLFLRTMRRVMTDVLPFCTWGMPLLFWEHVDFQDTKKLAKVLNPHCKNFFPYLFLGYKISQSFIILTLFCG